jgi:hypothetical protein
LNGSLINFSLQREGALDTNVGWAFSVSLHRTLIYLFSDRQFHQSFDTMTP